MNEALKRLQQQTQLFELVGHRQDGVSQILCRSVDRAELQKCIDNLSGIYPSIRFEICQVTDKSIWWGSKKEVQKIQRFFAGKAID